MTIIDELLILLDDVGETPPESIPGYFEKYNLQVIFSSLGRLVNRGWVARKIKRQLPVYSITIHGVNELNKTLGGLSEKENQPWDRRWRLVIFDIPESKRKLRDQFRNFLRQLGFGQLKSSVWLSPWNKGEKVKPYIKRHHLGDIVTQFTTEPSEDSYYCVQLAQQSWDWAGLEDKYREFIEDAERQSRDLSNDAIARFKAKRLVFRYAQIVAGDPCLPSDISPISTPARRAADIYAKIRPYCLPAKIRENILRMGSSAGEL